MPMVDLTNVSQIPGTECLGDSRDRINDNTSYLKDAIMELQTAVQVVSSFTGGSGVVVNALSANTVSITPGVTLTGITTTATSITADNTFIKVIVNGNTKYLRLFDI